MNFWELPRKQKWYEPILSIAAYFGWCGMMGFGIVGMLIGIRMIFLGH